MVQDLQAFLGAVNFYRRFLPAAASLLQPLTDPLHGETRARDSLPWSTEMEAAFCSIKTVLANAALLARPTPGAEICLMVDASANHMGAALQPTPPDRIAASSPDQPAPTQPERIAASPPDQPAPTPPDRLAVPGWRRPWPG
jgi:hypothetical protein